MKYRIVIALTLVSLSAGAWAVSPCQEKAKDIQREISYAEKHHNQNRINGLKKALDEVNAHCSDRQVLADHQKKIARQKDEVTERRQELNEAKQKGDADKIDKRERKLREAQDELKALESRDY
jgi:rubrerythrin